MQTHIVSYDLQAPNKDYDKLTGPLKSRSNAMRRNSSLSEVDPT